MWTQLPRDSCRTDESGQSLVMALTKMWYLPESEGEQGGSKEGARREQGGKARRVYARILTILIAESQQYVPTKGGGTGQ